MTLHRIFNGHLYDNALYQLTLKLHKQQQLLVMSPAKIQWFQELVGNIGFEKVMTHQLIIIPELVKLYVLCQHQENI